MKVVIHNGARVWGGNEKWLANVAAGLQDRGHDVVVSCRSPGVVGERLRERGVRTTGIRPGGDLDPVRAIRFALWLRRERPDAVLSTSWNRLPWIAWAARWARVPRLVVRLGIVRPAPTRGPHFRAFRRSVDAMIVNAEEIRDEWLRSAPWFPTEAVRVVYNGVTPATPLGPEARLQLRRELGVPDDAPLLCGVGNLHPRKGFDLLIEAFAAIPVPEARLVIVGRGPHLPELRALATRLRVGDRVRWAGFRADVPAVLAAADLFVLSSRNEGMANVVLEAMAAGTPVVATDISGIVYALGPDADSGPAGWIVPPEDAAAIARSASDILRLLRAEPEAVLARVEEARRRARERFGIERMVVEVEEVLRGARP